jgi:Zn-dependent protease
VDFDNARLLSLILRLPVVFFSLTIHEFMHGWVAHKCGDDTALRAGRLTLNPIAHLDIIGTICLFFGPLGWAKPVPVNPMNYGRPRRDDILVSGAGIAANFAVAAALAILARVLVLAQVYPETRMAEIGWAMMGEAIFLNFGLAVFNLLPVFPLDGSHILKNLLPLNAAIVFSNISRYGGMLLIAVVLLGQYVPFLAWPIIMLMLSFTGLDAASVVIDCMQKFHMF